MVVMRFAAYGRSHYGATLGLLLVLLTVAMIRSGVFVVRGLTRTAPLAFGGCWRVADDGGSSDRMATNAAFASFHHIFCRVRTAHGRPAAPPPHAARRRRRRRHRYDADDHGQDDDDDDDDCTRRVGGIPQLPAAFQSHKTGPAAPAAAPLFQPNVASRKFQLQYTCNVCETRNKHAVTRIAYRQGVVIARCRGCDTQHLIADNLGFTCGFPSSSSGSGNSNETRTTTTIEEHFADTGAGVVSRVSKEVFDLEHVLQVHDAKSGSIMGENGELAME